MWGECYFGGGWGKLKGKGKRIWEERMDKRFVSDFWLFFLLDDVLTFGKKGRGMEDVWVWFEEDGHSIQVS